MNIDNKEVKFFLTNRKQTNQNGKQIRYRDKYEATAVVSVPEKSLSLTFKTNKANKIVDISLFAY